MSHFSRFFCFFHARWTEQLSIPVAEAPDPSEAELRERGGAERVRRTGAREADMSQRPSAWERLCSPKRERHLGLELHSPQWLSGEAAELPALSQGPCL
jgi:hypothetical protein